jgi:hypothetical protein
MSRFDRPIKTGVTQRQQTVNRYKVLHKTVSLSDIRENLQKVYGEAALSKGAILKWMKPFKLK